MRRSHRTDDREERGEEALSILGPGQRLDPELRARMEHAFGQGFAGVRVHDDGPGRRLARDRGAVAVTHGSDVALGQGRPDLDSEIGQALMAHELAHVVQQGAADRGGVGMGPQAEHHQDLGPLSSGPLERDADQSALRTMEAMHGAPGVAPPAGHAAPRRRTAGLALQSCETVPDAAEMTPQAPCGDGPATCTIDSAVRPRSGDDANFLTIEGHTCIQAGLAEVYRYEGDVENCNMSGTLHMAPIMVMPVVLGNFTFQLPIHMSTTPGEGRKILIRVIDATDESKTAIDCATVTAS